MIASLRGKILARLLIVAVALASIAGGGLYFVERRNIDQRIFALALEETRSLVGTLDFLSEPRRPDFDLVNSRIASHVLAEHIDESHFVAIQIYDLDRRKVAESVHPDFRAVAEAVDAQRLEPKAGEPYAHAWLTFRGDSYVQVVAPLQVAGKTVAHFHGTFRVDPEAMRQMNRGLALSVLLVVLVLLATSLVLYPIMLRLNGDLLRLTDDLALANMGMLAALGSAVARRDRGTNAHNYRVTIYAIYLARALGLSAEEVRGLVKGAFLHDVGKIGIADAILRKPARLTPEETLVMQAHVRYGVEMVGKFEWLRDAVEVVRCHHERFDGLGYPAGLRGEEIPIAARIFAVVDVFDALTTRRPYKAPVPFADTMRQLEEGRGSHFDPVVLSAFESIAPELYRSNSGADELQLTRTLDRLMVHYFPAPSGAHGRRGPLHLGVAARVTGSPSQVAMTPVPAPVEELGYLSGSWWLEAPGRDREPSGGPIAGPPPQDDPFRDVPALVRPPGK
jgi:HD-GYP domain-containing protein (c-di-GMP phosphodiesterase class II)